MAQQCVQKLEWLTDGNVDLRFAQVSGPSYHFGLTSLALESTPLLI